MAEQERKAISRRTREALAAARESGVKLGNPRGAAALRRAGKGGAALREAVERNADQHAEDLRAVAEDVRAADHRSLRAIADELNARGILARRGGRWHVSNVRNLLRRLDDHSPTAFAAERGFIGNKREASQPPACPTQQRARRYRGRVARGDN